MPDVHKRDPFLQMDTVYQKKRECATLFPLDFDFDPASGYSSRPNVIKLVAIFLWLDSIAGV